MGQPSPALALALQPQARAPKRLLDLARSLGPKRRRIETQGDPVDMPAIPVRAYARLRAAFGGRWGSASGNAAIKAWAVSDPARAMPILSIS